MNLAILIIVFVASAEWYKHRRVAIPRSAQYVGAPTPNRMMPLSVPVAENQSITEAAYNQTPRGYVPAFGYTEVDGHEEIII